LEASPEMLGLQMLCPYCHVPFWVRKQDSIEYRYEREKIEARGARLWLRISIVAAVAVVLGLSIMILLSL
jgi:hypothetical protein